MVLGAFYNGACIGIALGPFFLVPMRHQRDRGAAPAGGWGARPPPRAPPPLASPPGWVGVVVGPPPPRSGGGWRPCGIAGGRAARGGGSGGRARGCRWGWGLGFGGRGARARAPGGGGGGGGVGGGGGAVNASRKKSRKASIGFAEPPVCGRIPGVKPQARNGASSSGSPLITWIGTSRHGSFAGDQRRRLVVADQDQQRVAVDEVRRVGREHAEHVVDRTRVLRAHPLGIAPDHLGRVAVLGPSREHAAVADRRPVLQHRRDRRPGRMAADQRDFGEQGRSAPARSARSRAASVY